ncbi:hypothetical protein [Anabaena sp. UHCC 0253]|nr:hypothetical protein [Anabaena sp. UHCC 0253]
MALAWTPIPLYTFLVCILEPENSATTVGHRISPPDVRVQCWN